MTTDEAVELAEKEILAWLDERLPLRSEDRQQFPGFLRFRLNAVAFTAGRAEALAYEPVRVHYPNGLDAPQPYGET